MELKHLLKQTFWIYLFAYLAAPLGYLVRIFYARTFSVEDFGLIYAVIGFFTLISTFSDLGFSEALNYFLTKYYEKKDYAKVKGIFNLTLLIQSGTLVLLGLIFYYFSPQIAMYYFKSTESLSVFRFFIGYFIFVSLSRPLIYTFNAIHNYFYKSLSEFFKMFFILLFSFFISSLNDVAVVWGISLFLVCLILFVKLKSVNFMKFKPDYSYKLFKKMFKFSFYLMLGSGALLLLARIDVLMLTYLTDLRSVGLYSVALAIASIVGHITSPIVSLMFPLTTKLDNPENIEQLKNIIRTLYNFGLYVSTPILIMFAVFPKEVINLLFGSNYLMAQISLIILSLFYFVNLFLGFNFAVLGGLGLVKKRTFVLYVAATLNIVLNYFLIQSYGLEGAAFATLFSGMYMFIHSLILILRKTEINLKLSNLFKIFVSNVIILFVAYLLKTVLVLNFYIEASIIAISLCSIYVFLGYYFNIVDKKRIQFMFREVKNVFLSKGR